MFNPKRKGRGPSHETGCMKTRVDLANQLAKWLKNLHLKRFEESAKILSYNCISFKLFIEILIDISLHNPSTWGSLSS